MGSVVDQEAEPAVRRIALVACDSLNRTIGFQVNR
jgi:hypothetical protein